MATTKAHVHDGSKRTQRAVWKTRDEQIQYKCARQLIHRRKVTVAFILSVIGTSVSMFFSAGVLVIFPLGCASAVFLFLLIEANAHLKEIRGRV